MASSKNRMPPKQSSLKQVEEIAKQVEDLLEQGIIERSTANTIHRLWLFLN
jgi:hypothetical protein